MALFIFCDFNCFLTICFEQVLIIRILCLLCTCIHERKWRLGYSWFTLEHGHKKTRAKQTRWMYIGTGCKSFLFSKGRGETCMRLARIRRWDYWMLGEWNAGESAIDSAVGLSVAFAVQFTGIWVDLLAWRAVHNCRAWWCWWWPLPTVPATSVKSYSVSCKSSTTPWKPQFLTSTVNRYRLHQPVPWILSAYLDRGSMRSAARFSPPPLVKKKTSAAHQVMQLSLIRPELRQASCSGTRTRTRNAALHGHLPLALIEKYYTSKGVGK